MHFEVWITLKKLDLRDQLLHRAFIFLRLMFQANDKQVWNGFPVNSNITVRRIDEKFDFPVINLFVPLPQDYNGSLVSHTIPNLAVKGTFSVLVQFCSNGGCGPASEATVSCEQCLLINPGNACSALFS